MNSPQSNQPNQGGRPEDEARKWSRQNEEQAPAMNPREEQSVRESQKRQGGAPESQQSRETFAQREKRPGETGLANEARPGLGTRSDSKSPTGESKPARPGDRGAVVQDDGLTPPKADPKKHQEPRPAPREQAPDSMAHELERSSGASGMSGGV